MKTYVAKSPHKWPCDLCGDKILPGDRVAMWCWRGEDPPGNGCFGGISRVHTTCDAIASREDLYDESLTQFSDADECRHDQIGGDGSIPDAAYLLSLEAEAALAAARRIK